jgi:hypothetical protein
MLSRRAIVQQWLAFVFAGPQIFAWPEAILTHNQTQHEIQQLMVRDDHYGTSVELWQ